MLVPAGLPSSSFPSGTVHGVAGEPFWALGPMETRVWRDIGRFQAMHSWSLVEPGWVKLLGKVGPTHHGSGEAPGLLLNPVWCQPCNGGGVTHLLFQRLTKSQLQGGREAARLNIAKNL